MAGIPVVGDSAHATVPGVKGTNEATSGGWGVEARGETGLVAEGASAGISVTGGTIGALVRANGVGALNKAAEVMLGQTLPNPLPPNQPDPFPVLGVRATVTKGAGTGVWGQGWGTAARTFICLVEPERACMARGPLGYGGPIARTPTDSSAVTTQNSISQLGSTGKASTEEIPWVSSATVIRAHPRTTSDTPGHAMKASDPAKSFGAVIWKSPGPIANRPRAYPDRGRAPVSVNKRGDQCLVLSTMLRTTH